MIFMHSSTGLAIWGGIVVLCRFSTGAMAPAPLPFPSAVNRAAANRGRGRSKAPAGRESDRAGSDVATTAPRQPIHPLRHVSGPHGPVICWLTRVSVHGTYVGDLLSGLLPMSIGIGLTFVPITLLGTGGVREEDAGLASGLFNTAQQVGGALGLAILSTLAASRTASALTNHAGLFAAKVAGYHVAFVAAAIMLGAGALILATMLRPGHVRGVELDLTNASATPAPRPSTQPELAMESSGTAA